MQRRSSCIVERPAMPDYVLDVIRDSYRHQVEYDPESEPGVDLSFETSVAEWRDACDLIAWKPLGKALGSEWRFNATSSEWKAVLEPANEKRLFDVCGFIASRATRFEVVPSRLLGSVCYGGGTFLAVRQMLSGCGAEVGSLRPSDAIAPYLKSHIGVFLGPISGLAPNRLPPIKVHNSSANAYLVLFLAGVFSASAFNYFDSSIVVLAAIAVAVTGLILARVDPGVRYQFPGIATFRDLVECMLGDGAAPDGRCGGAPSSRG